MSSYDFYWYLCGGWWSCSWWRGLFGGRGTLLRHRHTRPNMVVHTHIHREKDSRASAQHACQISSPSLYIHRWVPGGEGFSGGECLDGRCHLIDVQTSIRIHTQHALDQLLSHTDPEREGRGEEEGGVREEDLDEPIQASVLRRDGGSYIHPMLSCNLQGGPCMLSPTFAMTVSDVGVSVWVPVRVCSLGPPPPSSSYHITPHHKSTGVHSARSISISSQAPLSHPLLTPSLKSSE